MYQNQHTYSPSIFEYVRVLEGFQPLNTAMGWKMVYPPMVYPPTLPVGTASLTDSAGWVQGGLPSQYGVPSHRCRGGLPCQKEWNLLANSHYINLTPYIDFTLCRYQTSNKCNPHPCEPLERAVADSDEGHPPTSCIATPPPLPPIGGLLALWVNSQYKNWWNRNSDNTVRLKTTLKFLQEKLTIHSSQALYYVMHSPYLKFSVVSGVYINVQMCTFGPSYKSDHRCTYLQKVSSDPSTKC